MSYTQFSTHGVVGITAQRITYDNFTELKLIVTDRDGEKYIVGLMMDAPVEIEHLPARDVRKHPVSKPEAVPA